MKVTQFPFCLILILVGAVPAQDSLNVRLVGRCDLPGLAYSVAVKGDYAYVADFDSGLQVILVSDPTHPVVVGSCEASRLAYAVAVGGEYAYVGDVDSSLRVISVADPAHPVEVGVCTTPAMALGVEVNGDYAYVVGFGLSVISVADPAHPVEVGYCETPRHSMGVAVAGDYAYVGGSSDGLSVISVADPTHPTEVGRCITPGRAYGVEASGGYAYVACSDAGLRVISIDSAPVEIGSYPDTICDVALGDHYAYVVRGSSGENMRVISVADPTHPVEVGYYWLGKYSVALSRGFVFVCSGRSLAVLQFYGGGVEEVPSAEVSTTNRGASIVRGVLTLAAEGSGQNTRHRAELLNAAGRKVLQLHAGANDVSRLSPGVYFVRSEPQTIGFKRQVVCKVIVAE